jgi:conjugal transfer pilus assembly protein TraF
MSMLRRSAQIVLLTTLLSAGGVVLAQDANKPTAAASDADTSAEAAQGEKNWWDQDVWNNPQRGFNWYPPAKKPKPKTAAKEPEAEAPKTAAKPKNFRDIRDLEEFQKEIKRLREVAIFDPTPNNVHTYLQAQEYAMSRSQVFADTARRVVWQNPDVDFTAKSPQANYSLTNQRARAEERRYDVLAEISKNHGLIFFFKADCPYCHDMAPVLQSMQAQYGIEVMPVSMDGRAIQEFPRAKRDNGISKFVSRGEGITTVPAVYLVSNDKKTVVLLGTGAMAMDEIAERIRVLMTTQVGNDY